MAVPVQVEVVVVFVVEKVVVVVLVQDVMVEVYSNMLRRDSHLTFTDICACVCVCVFASVHV